uniref:Uncharacterized protein n=1 Tax=Moniliophthora roreri TaxID=221103 RepID=A0A0W0GE17_MONRR
MPPLTRRSLRNAVSPSPSTTPTTNPSPFFSARTSTAGSPPSEIEEPAKPTKATRTSRKRKAQSDNEEAESNDESVVGSRTGVKRRAVANRAYVEIGKTVNKGRVDVPKQVNKPKTSAKGKGKVAAPAPADSDDERVSDSELEYDENKSIADSDSSGSDFVASDEENEYGQQDESNSDYDSDQPLRNTRSSPRKQTADIVSDSEDDEIMLNAAIQLSRDEMTLGTGTGPSSGKGRAANAEAVRRAEAAERRIAKQSRNGFDVDDAAMDIDDDNDDDTSDISSDDDSDEPLTLKGKGKAKAKDKASVAKTADSGNKFMTLAQMRQARREEKRRLREENKSTKAEEKALKKKLGRKLTTAEKSTIALHKNHSELRDVWGDLEANIKVISPVKAEQPAGIKLNLLPFQLESLYWMRKQEEGVWHGGMLADEMGMGKTIQIIALLVSDRKKPNLVVAPTVAIMQWRNEIEAHTDPNLKVLVWHGASRESDIKELKKYDVVLTTYAVLESAFRKQQSGFKRSGKIIKEKSPVHQIQWNRIILDEAHNIKERSTNTAKAAFELQADRRWCLSGTPLQNRVGELYSLVRFLGGDPFSYYFCKRCDCKSLHWKFSDKRTCDDCGHSPMQHTCFWNNEILSPIQKHGMLGPGKFAFKKLKILLDRMMLRRTKLQRADDLGLPPRTVIVRNDYFSPEERELYLSLFSDAKRQFSTYLDHGTILNNYSNIFSLLTRMRQMACHPDLVIRSKNNAGKFITENEGEATVCRICNDVAEDAIQAKCRHIFDRECIKQYLNTAIEQNPACPVCFVPLTIDLEAPALDLEGNLPDVRQGILGRLDLDKWRSSTKIEALLEELSNLRNQDASTKSIVFSQFVNFLDLIAYRLKKAGFNICRLEGTMSPQARDATIKHFMNNVEVTVFLVSLKAGGVALNLTEASRVYLMDSWWNPAVEFQAMDRIHRLGQHRPVKAIKLVVEDSIESRIVQLQEKKSAMIDATLSPDDSAMGRLTPEDVIVILVPPITYTHETKIVNFPLESKRSSSISYTRNTTGLEFQTLLSIPKTLWRRRRTLILGIFAAAVLAWWISAIVHSRSSNSGWIVQTILAWFALGLIIFRFLPTKGIKNFITGCETSVKDRWFDLPSRVRIATGWIILLGVVFGSVFGIASHSKESTERAIGLLGVLVFQLGFWITSNNRSHIPWPTVIVGLLLQQIVALFVLKTDVGFSIFDWIITLKWQMRIGSSFTWQPPSILFFMAFVEAMYYLGIMQWLLKKIGWFFFKIMDISGAEAVVASGSPLVGQGESVLLVKPYMNEMTRSELHLMLTSGFSTISGSFVAAYTALGVPSRNLITSAVMSIPASIAISKVRFPEMEEPVTKGVVVVDRGEDPAKAPGNLMHAWFRGARFGLFIVGQVIGNTLAYLSLLALLNNLLTWIGRGFGIQDLTLVLILGYVFYPLAFLIGIPRDELLPVAQLLATKFVSNELLAYANLQTLMESDNPLSERAYTITSYALCGFANLSSLAVQSVLIALAPDRAQVIVKVAFSALICGYVSTLQTAAIA